MTAMQLAMPAQAKWLPRLAALHKLAQMHMCRYTYALPSRLLLQVGLEVAERLGCLFTDYKGRRPAVAGFFFIVVMYKVCVHFQRITVCEMYTCPHTLCIGTVLCESQLTCVLSVLVSAYTHCYTAVLPCCLQILLAVLVGLMASRSGGNTSNTVKGLCIGVVVVQVCMALG